MRSAEKDGIMIVIVSALTVGCILSLFALGVYISFTIFDFPDITADGSFTTGAAIAAIMISTGFNPILATLSGAAGGFGAGVVTGVLHARFRVNKLLSGILVMTALYSLDLHIMGSPSVNIPYNDSLATYALSLANLFSNDGGLIIEALNVSMQEIMVLVLVFFIMVAMCIMLFWFFKTKLGMAMRAAGANDRMIRSLGADVGFILILGMAISNGLIALSGAIFAQLIFYSADIQMGIGMIVSGLASVIIGDTLFGRRGFGWTIAGAALGSVLFRLVITGVLQLGVPQTDLKLINAFFVFVALVATNTLRQKKKNQMKQELPGEKV